MSEFLVTSRRCGCVVLMMVNETQNVVDCAADLRREYKAGRTPVDTTREQLDATPLHCPEHPKGWRKGKPVTT